MSTTTLQTPPAEQAPGNDEPPRPARKRGGAASQAASPRTAS